MSTSELAPPTSNLWDFSPVCTGSLSLRVLQTRGLLPTSVHGTPMVEVCTLSSLTTNPGPTSHLPHPVHPKGNPITHSVSPGPMP